MKIKDTTLSLVFQAQTGNPGPRDGLYERVEFLPSRSKAAEIHAFRRLYVLKAIPGLGWFWLRNDLLALAERAGGDALEVFLHVGAPWPVWPCF